MGASAPSATSTWVDAFVQRLHELGWIEGRNIATEYWWAEGRFERLAGFLRALQVLTRVDLLNHFFNPI
jgi:putative ABC transport system substrate-binding protein